MKNEISTQIAPGNLASSLRYTIADSLIRDRAKNHEILLSNLHSHRSFHYGESPPNVVDHPLHYEDDGSLYLGQWLDGKKHGRGVWLRRLSKGNAYFYEGHWSEGKREGLGRVIVNNGGIYEGMWKADHKHGTGVFKFPPGDECLRYEGDFVDGWLTGQGTMFYGDGTKYIG